MLPVIFMSNLSPCSSEQTPFHVWPTHLAVMERRGDTYYLFSVWQMSCTAKCTNDREELTL